MRSVSRFVAVGQVPGLPTQTPGILVERKGGQYYPIWTLRRETYRWKAKERQKDWTGVADDMNALLRD